MSKDFIRDREITIALFLSEYKGLAIVQAVSNGVMGLFLEQFLIYLDKHGLIVEGK